MGRLHNYVFGEPVGDQTQHKPLEMSWKKNFANASLRRQSLLLRLANINFKWNTTVGRTHALSWVNPLSPKPMDSKPDGCDLPHFNRPSNRQKQSGHLCWFSSKPVTILNLSRLATSEAATPRTSIILRTVITKRSFLLKMTWCSKPIDLWFQLHWEQSIKKIFKRAT